jgi:DtxR family Mn-dependent transcriptional regulator
VTKQPNLSESLEDYLEVILDLERENKVARAKEIAERLGVQRGSVTGALKNLSERKLINYEPYSYITLTALGKKIAAKITQRHEVLKDFFFRILQLDEERAEATACRMEHAIDDLGMARLIAFIDYAFRCPHWIEAFGRQIEGGTDLAKVCKDCRRECDQAPSA